MMKFSLKILSITLFSLLLIKASCYAQKFHIGETTKGGPEYNSIVLGDDEEAIYVLANIYGDDYVETYKKSSNQKKLFSTPLVHGKVNKNSVKLEQVALLKNNFVLFYSYYDDVTSEYCLFTETVNSQNGQKSENSKEVFRVNVEKEKRAGEFYVTISSDKSKVFIYHEAYHKSRKMMMRRYVLLNSDCNVLFEKEIEIGEFMPKSFIIDNDGSVLYLFKRGEDLIVGAFDANKGFEKWEQKVEFEHDKAGVYTFTNLTININLRNELTITGLIIEFEDLNKVTVGTKISFGGVTKSSDPSEKIIGCIFVSLDRQSKEIKHAKINKFSDEFLSQFLSTKDLKKKKQGRITLGFSNEKIINKNDGSIVMMLENYSKTAYYESVYSIPTKDPYSATTPKHDEKIGEKFVYGDLIVLNFTNEGELSWANRIPKMQSFKWKEIGLPFLYSTSGLQFLNPEIWSTIRYFSYSATILNNQLVVLHNDLLENTLIDPANTNIKVLKDSDDAIVVKTSIDLTNGIKTSTNFKEFQTTQSKLCMFNDLQKNENDDLILLGINDDGYSYSLLRTK